jgi:hypothetical protein
MKKMKKIKKLNISIKIKKNKKISEINLIKKDF